MTTAEIFSHLELIGFIVGIVGGAIAITALVDAWRDARNRRGEGKNCRVLLIATKNRRIAWVMLAVFVRDIVIYGFAITQGPTLVQNDPAHQTWITYLSDGGRALLLLWFVWRNYQDYRRALYLARGFKK